MMWKEIDVQSGQFVANGNTYFIQPEKITPYRFQVWQSMSLELSENATFSSLYDAFQNIFNASTQGNDMLSSNHKVAETSYNAMQQMKDIRMSSNIHLKFCALFINRDGEDVTRWDDALVEQKLNDWKKEPFDMSVFFSLAMSQVPGLIARLNDTSNQNWQPIKRKRTDTK